MDAALRQVTATFGRRGVQEDHPGEVAFAGYLRETHSTEALISLFARFTAGESAFDGLMRRMCLRAVCKRVGCDLQIGPHVVLKHPETMEFGDSVFIGAQAIIQGRFDGRCVIGSHVWIGPQAFLDARNLVLGDYVGWGPGAKVLGSVHTGQPNDAPIITTSLVIKPVRVGYGADIGMGANILPGVHVGAHSIVGAGAVVTRDVPEYAIAAGVPARVIRFRREQIEFREER